MVGKMQLALHLAPMWVDLTVLALQKEKLRVVLTHLLDWKKLAGKLWGKQMVQLSLQLVLRLDLLKEQ